MNSRKRFKFVTPQFDSSKLVRRGNFSQKKNMLITADIHTPGSTVSQGITLENLLGEKLQADTPALKKLMLKRIQKFQPNVSPIEQHVSPINENNLPPEHVEVDYSSVLCRSMEIKETAISQKQNTNDCEGKLSAYVFPTSPNEKKEKRKLVRERETHNSSKKGLLRYVFATLREIEEIRAKRKILKQQGLAGFKRFKSSRSLS